MDSLREATIAHMSQLHLYNCPHAICRPRRCKEAGSRNTATSGPAASHSGASHTFFLPFPPFSHVRILSRSRALSCLSLSFFLHLFLSLSRIYFFLFLSLSHTGNFSLSLCISLFLFPHKHSHDKHRKVLSLLLSPRVDFFLSLSHFVSRTHTHTHREMLTLGNIPFFELTADHEIIAHVCAGGILLRKLRCARN